MQIESHIQQDFEMRRRVQAVKLAIGVSLAVCLLEIGLGWFLGLESLLAEGVHTFLDGVDSVIVLIAVFMAARPADRSHQFGYGKFEALGAAVEGSFVLVAAGGIAYRAIDRLLAGRQPGQIPVYVCLAMGGAAIVYLFVSLYLMRLARETKSPAVLAEALHLRTHIYITVGLGVGLLVGFLGDWPVVDTILALGVAICLVVIAYQILREVFKQFMDESLPPDEIEHLGTIINRFSDQFVEVHGLRTRQAGVERHIEMHLVVMPQTTVTQAHDLSHEIEAAIMYSWTSARITVHIEPLNIEHSESVKGQPKVRTHDISPDEREFIH